MNSNGIRNAVRLSLRFFESEDHDLSLKNDWRWCLKDISSFRILFDFRQLIDRSLISVCSIYAPKGFICLISRQWKRSRTFPRKYINDYCLQTVIKTSGKKRLFNELFHASYHSECWSIPMYGFKVQILNLLRCHVNIWKALKHLVMN